MCSSDLAEANGGHCHVNWRRVCRPISLGGLGVQDLERAGLALRIRWLWFSRTDTERAWHGLDLQFSAEERALFFASTHMVIGDGETAKFWTDRWINGRAISEIAPLLYQCVPKRRRKSRTVVEGLQGTRQPRCDWTRRNRAIPTGLAADRAHTPHGNAGPTDLEVDSQWSLLCQVLLRRDIPWLDD